MSTDKRCDECGTPLLDEEHGQVYKGDTMCHRCVGRKEVRPRGKYPSQEKPESKPQSKPQAKHFPPRPPFGM